MTSSATLFEQYKSILHHYITNGGEAELEQAYEFVRQAIEREVSIFQIIDAHNEALHELLSEQESIGGEDSPTRQVKIYQRASSLLKEALAPFELARLGFIDTINLLKSQNEQLTKLMEERSDLLQQREDFMMVVTHDLKTPLTALDRCLSLVLEGDFGEISPKQHEVMTTMKDSNQRMFTMVKNLLEAYRYEQSKPILNLDVLDLSSLLKKLREEFKWAAEARALNLEYVEPSNLNLVNADETAMRHVFSNLIDNALKFTPKGGAVTISTYNSGANVVIEVKDTGKGISPQDIPRLFQRFFQSESGRKQYTGTGLGLFLCRQILQAHGGEISCQSQPGAGTTFIVALTAYSG